MGLIFILLLDIFQLPGGVPGWRHPMGARTSRVGIMKNVQHGALVLEKKRSAFYFHQDDDPGENSLARGMKNTGSLHRTHPTSFAGGMATGSDDQ